MSTATACRSEFCSIPQSLELFAFLPEEVRPSLRVIYRWAEQGLFPSLRLGGKLLVRRADIEHFIASGWHGMEGGSDD